MTLRRHPELAFSTIKEPYFFADDYPRRREMEDETAYTSLFAHARDGQLRGEASAIYLSSETAIPVILKRRPDAKFIAVVRDPVEMFISWHNECLKSLDEDEKDPERAWRLQGRRADGFVPSLCKEPGYLRYQKICSLGEQIRNLFDLVPVDQRLVILWDDLAFRPRNVHRQITGFLGIKDLGSTDFLRENGYSSHQSRTVARVARSVFAYDGLKKLRLRIKPFLNRHGIRPLKWAVDLSLKKATKPSLSREFREELQVIFNEDVLLLGTLLNRDLSHWRTESLKAKRMAS